MTEHKNIYIALAAAQTDMGGVKKGSVNPAFKSKYADLADVVAAVSPALNAQGIAFFHVATSVEGERVMRTVLAHGPSDTRIECDVPLIVTKNDMQGYKSATTYAKRIGLESLTGVAPEDDDGNAARAAAPSRQIPETPEPAQRATKANSRDLFATLQAGLRKCKSSGELRQWGEAFADDIKKMDKSFADQIRAEYKAEMNAFMDHEIAEEQANADQ